MFTILGLLALPLVAAPDQVHMQFTAEQVAASMSDQQVLEYELGKMAFRAKEKLPPAPLTERARKILDNTPDLMVRV